MKTLYHAKPLSVALVILVGMLFPHELTSQVNPLSSTGYSEDAVLGHWLEARPVAVHDEGVLSGQTTYRIYMHFLHEDDYLLSCSGDQWMCLNDNQRRVVQRPSECVLECFWRLPGVLRVVS